MGCAGSDTLFGDAGSDSLVGGIGNDTLYGGLDDDKIAVGGADVHALPPAALVTRGHVLIGDWRCC